MNVFDHASQIYAKAAEIGLWAGINSPGYKVDSGGSRHALDEACHLGNTAARDYLEWADNIKKERPELFEPTPSLAPMTPVELYDFENEKWREDMEFRIQIQQEADA